MALVVAQPKPTFDKNKIQWPLSYSLSPSPTDGSRRRWWSHEYYRGPENQPVRILYSQSNADSERIALSFLNEPVLGFDMEWPWDKTKPNDIGGRVALIQLACEDKIALFHIALHDGQTNQELIAPALRRIIESADIIKAGVSIMNADFKRLKLQFQLEPRGAFELSHMHRLVTSRPGHAYEISTRLCSLSTQTEHHLGLPLDKGVRQTCDWSVPLDDQEKNYAANDAYASFMLFHCMNAKRLRMKTVFPIPRPAETYLPFELVPPVAVQLEVKVDGTKAVTMTAQQFLASQATRERFTDARNASQSVAAAANRPNKPKRFIEEVLRLRLRAFERGIMSMMSPRLTERIIPRDTINHLISTPPQTRDELHQVPGIQGFLQACEEVDRDLWKNWAEWEGIKDGAQLS